MVSDPLTRDRRVKLYGEGSRLFDWLHGREPAPDEVLFEGVTGCGKSRLLCEWVKAACTLYPKSKGIIIRETRVSLNDSVLEIWESEVLGMLHPAVQGPGRAHRRDYQHDQLGGRVALGGYDKPLSLFSTQWDWVWFNEVQETTKEKWELLSRAMRQWMSDAADAESGMPCSGIIIGDCNPDTKFHWANQRFPARSNVIERHEDGGRIRLIGRFWDNPKIYDHEEKRWTPKGQQYLAKLRRNLSGVRKRRLFQGEWVAAEGAVWEDFDTEVHVVQAALGKDTEEGYVIRPITASGQPWKRPNGEPWEFRIKWFFGSQDIGHTEPGVAQVWGLDTDGRMWMVAEVYKTQHDHDEWADFWVKMDDEFPLQAIVTDHDKAFIDNLNKRIGPRRNRGLKEIVRKCSKERDQGEKTGIDQVRVRLKQRADGTRGIYFLADALKFGEDLELVDAAQPTRTIQELPAYVYRLKEDGKPYKEEPDPSCVDHGCDALRYAADFAAWRNLTPEKKKRKRGPHTYGHALGHDAVMEASSGR